MIDLTVAPPEYRPRVFDTPEGPWLLTMTHTALRLRPFGASDGFTLETGDNANLNSHLVCVGRTLHVVYQDAHGTLGRWTQSLDAPRSPFVVPTPGTPVPIPGTPSMTPLDLVTQVRAKYPTPLGAQHAACLLEIATTLGNDAGLLRKDSGTVVTLPDGTRVAQDIIAYPDGRIYDVLGDAEGAATPQWSDKGTVEPSRYYRVNGSPQPNPGTIPPDVGTSPAEVKAHLDALFARVAKLEAWAEGQVFKR